MTPSNEDQPADLSALPDTACSVDWCNDPSEVLNSGLGDGHKFTLVWPVDYQEIAEAYKRANWLWGGALDGSGKFIPTPEEIEYSLQSSIRQLKDEPGYWVATGGHVVFRTATGKIGLGLHEKLRAFL